MSYSRFNDWRNNFIFSLWQKSAREADDRIFGGRLFQRTDAATGNERRPTVARRYVGTCSWCDENERRRRRLPKLIQWKDTKRNH